MIDKFNDNSSRYYQHQRSVSLPSPILIYQIPPMSIPLLDPFVNKSTTKGNKCSTATIVNDSRERSNFGDVLAYSFDFPKLYSQILGNINDIKSVDRNFGFDGGIGGHLFSKKVIGNRKPPENYICRLCHFPGHWIDQCILFRPKNGFRIVIKRECVFCFDPSHSTVSCTNFVPINNYQQQQHQGVKRFVTGYAYDKKCVDSLPILDFL